MIVELASIGSSPKAINETFDSDQIGLEGNEVALVGPVSLNGEAVAVGGRAHLRGTLTADLTLDCVRCLEPVKRHFDISFDSVFVDASDETGESDTEIADEELDESLVENGLIDTAEVVREQLLLAVPFQELCREDCKGLCPKCGGNRNLIDCRCKDDEVDPRWAALKGLN